MVSSHAQFYLQSHWILLPIYFFPISQDKDIVPSSEIQLSRENSGFSLHFRGPQIAREWNSSAKEKSIQPKFECLCCCLQAWSVHSHHGTPWLRTPTRERRAHKEINGDAAGEATDRWCLNPPRRMWTQTIHRNIQKKNVSVFTKNHIVYPCHKIDEDFPCVNWNCALQHSPFPASPGATPEHGPLSDPASEIPVINSIN